MLNVCIRRKAVRRAVWKPQSCVWRASSLTVCDWFSLIIFVSHASVRCALAAAAVGGGRPWVNMKRWRSAAWRINNRWWLTVNKRVVLKQGAGPLHCPSSIFIPYLCQSKDFFIPFSQTIDEVRSFEYNNVYLIFFFFFGIQAGLDVLAGQFWPVGRPLGVTASCSVNHLNHLIRTRRAQ